MRVPYPLSCRGTGNSRRVRPANVATRRERDQFLRVSSFALDIVPAPACVDPRIAALAPAQLLEDFLKRRATSLGV
jgi:hypothetical protein